MKSKKCYGREDKIESDKKKNALFRAFFFYIIMEHLKFYRKENLKNTDMEEH